MTETLDAPNWTELRAKRSRFWRPGMNTRFEPYVALAETNIGVAAVPCHRDLDRAREVVTRWRMLAEQGLTDRGRLVVGAALVDPRGDIVEAWKLPDVGSIPDPEGGSRWRPLHQQGDWSPCRACGVARWPGCWVAVDGTGCSVCLPAIEAADPRVWPEEGPVSHPPVAKKKT